MKNVKIKGKKYAIKYSVRALFLYEQITQKPFTIDSLEYVLDRYLLAYCIVLASNKDCVLDWDEFVAAADDDPSILQKINDMIIEQQKLNDKINRSEDEDDNDPKKD